MMIEFQCPACKAPLAVQRSSAGGQVDCPRCRELILIPLSPAGENAQGKTPRESREDTIQRFVTPYRNELANKRAQLNEAIEEIKNRNQRIRELENIGLRVQRDLWSVEAEYEERREDFRRLVEERRNGGGNGTAGTAQEEKLRKEIERLAAQIADIEKTSSKSGAAQTRAESLRGEFQALQASYEALAQRNSRAESELLRLREEVTGLTAGLAERRRMAVSAARTLAAFIEESEGARASVEGEIRALATLAGDTAGLDRLQDTAAKLSDRTATLLKEAERAGKRHRDQTLAAARATGELQEQRNRAETLQKELAAAAGRERETAGRLETAARDSAAERKTLQQEAEAVRARLAESQEKIKSLEKEKSAIDQARASLETKAEKAAEQTATQTAERARLSEALQRSDLALKTAVTERDRASGELTSARSRVSALESSARTLTAELAAAREQAAAQEKKLAAAETTTRDATTSRDREKERADRLALELDDSRKTEARLREEGRKSAAQSEATAATLRKDLEAARADTRALEQRLKESATALATATDRADRLQKAVAESDAARKSEAESAAKVKTQADRLATELSAARQEHTKETERLSREGAEAAERLQDLRKQLDAALVAARENDSKLKSASNEAGAARDRLAGLEKKLSAAEAAAREAGVLLKREKDRADEAVKKAETDRAEMQSRLDAAGSDSAATSRRLAETLRQLDEARSGYDALKNASTSTRALQEELAAAGSQMSDLRMETRRLTEELDRKERASREMSQLHQSLSNRIDHLTSEINAREVASEKVDRELTSTTEENRRLKSDLQRLRESGASPELIQARVAEKVRDLEADYEQKLRDLQDRNKSLENRIESDRHNSERLMRATDQQRLLTGKIQVLENSLREQEALNSRLQQRAQELADMEVQVGSAENRNRESEARLRAAEAETNSVRERADSLARDMQKLQEELTRARTSRRDTAAAADDERLRAAEARVRTLETERDHLAQRLAASESAATKAADGESSLKALENRLHETEQLLQKLGGGEAGGEMAQIVEEVRNSRGRIVTLEVQLRDLSSENTRLKSTVKTLTENLKAQWKKRETKSHLH